MSRKISSSTTQRQTLAEIEAGGGSHEMPALCDGELLELAVARLAAYVRQHAVPLHAGRAQA
jgi:hypothetical protein